MKPANTMIWLGVAVLLIGGLLIPAGTLARAFGAPNEEVTFESPGRASLEIVAPGRFYLWHDYRTIHENQQLVRGQRLPDGVSFEVVRADDGSTLAFQPSGGTHTEIGGTASRSIGYVDIKRPGRVDIEVGGGDGQLRILTFSRSRFMQFVRAIGISLLSLAILGTAGILLIVFGIARRTRGSNSS